MKPYEELTFAGRIRRQRQLAGCALKEFGLADARLQFLRQAGNTLFRVNQANPAAHPKTDRYAPGQYLLRIHQPGYQTPAAIELELEWLSSMCQADLPVPEPGVTLAGKFTTQVSLPGIVVPHLCSLLRWVKGRELRREEIRPDHYRALGELVARLHQHAEHWQAPAGQAKRPYDWDGLFRQAGEDGMPTSEAWDLLPPEYLEPFERVAQKTGQVMDRLGKGPEVYGLIHGDLGMGANVIFWEGDVRIIDFDDSGFGYYLFDLAIILEDSQDHQIQPAFREALLEGYTRLRPFGRDQAEMLDLFLAAYAVYWSLFAVDAVRFHPEDREEIYERMARYLRLVENYLSQNMR